LNKNQVKITLNYIKLNLLCIYFNTKTIVKYLQADKQNERILSRNRNIFCGFLHNVYICDKANKPRWSRIALLFTRFNGVLYWDWQPEANIGTDILRQYRIFESVVLTEWLRTNILLHGAMNEMKSTLHYSSSICWSNSYLYNVAYSKRILRLK